MEGTAANHAIPDISGWLLRRKLTHLPAGARINHIESFASRQGVQSRDLKSLAL
jgi:hypothetical protein